ncbi:hypothetical protein [Shouchella lonarensis]|uniref:Uncharacterized protein n=1 Tax=Shouchella lonarensis TaxID=1464122 RepID=A0A1G6GU58_9BACI|nr:hypothetical protein [Shouchella lonarensis]SDB85504.1 hypothetical protein SAMN05421737_10223 [Shouchella lonarensis]
MMMQLAAVLGISNGAAGALLIAGVAAVAVVSPMAAAQVAWRLASMGFTATRLW